MQSNPGTFEAETAQDYMINLPEIDSVTQPHWPGNWVLPSQQQKSLLLFLKGQPQVLGVAQILIGLTMLCLGVTISLPPNDCELLFCFTTKIGYHLWGPFSIQGSLGMNAVSATVAAIGVGVILLEEIVIYYGMMWNSPYAIAVTGMLTGMLLLSLAEGCVALSLCIFVCRAACSVNKVVVFLPNNDNIPSPDHIYDEVAFQ
ncbi:membrane-spanning 4-domains subfamily A member 4A-like isoform X3 [Hyaena hyaena]|uniref:membrane-spanning 4-domains subfamily A member 4A-like isoform X3 n=1 Tax=Hyaena hyaena TaxID=95912 RepID=UPI001921C30A|nr:membrane-spanning 4-domains subfamily A member 4A-like isoform X3 [Hyaena hyaena]